MIGFTPQGHHDAQRIPLTNFDVATSSLATLGQECRLPEGTTLWREGEPGDQVVLLLEGTLEVLREASDGHVVLIRQLHRGAIVGDIATVDKGARSATVRAQTECLIRRIPATEFLEKLDQEPILYKKLFWEQIARVRSLTDDMAASEREAITDPLTKLYNIRFFRQRLLLELERARQTSDPVSVAMFDVDHFKHYNDTNGHQGGDEVLVRIAEIFRGGGRRGDIVARYGGEEFIVLLYGATPDEAAIYGDHVRQLIELTDFPGGHSQPLQSVTVSGGIATFRRMARMCRR